MLIPFSSSSRHRYHHKYRLFWGFFVLTGKVSSFSPEPSLGFQCKRTNPTVINIQWRDTVTESRSINREGTTATSLGSHSRLCSPALGSGPRWICSYSPSVMAIRSWEYSDLYSLFLPMLSSLWASLLSVKRPWGKKKKRGRRQLRTSVGWGLAGYQLVKHKPNETVSSDQLAS